MGCLHGMQICMRTTTVLGHVQEFFQAVLRDAVLVPSTVMYCVNFKFGHVYNCTVVSSS